MTCDLSGGARSAKDQYYVAPGVSRKPVSSGRGRSGGPAADAVSLELVGALAESTFNAVNVGTAILGTDGISASAGVTTHDETEARTNHAMVIKAQRAVVVADGSKVGRVAFAQLAEIHEVAMLITDSTADPAELQRIRDAGVEVVIVDA